MSIDKPDQTQKLEGPLKNLILLTLPWLNLQREILDVAKKGAQEASERSPTESFTFGELQALLMILDPSRSFRNRFGPDFEERFRDVYKEFYSKFASGSLQFIDAQGLAVDHMRDALKTLLDTLRKRDQAKGQD